MDRCSELFLRVCGKLDVGPCL